MYMYITSNNALNLLFKIANFSYNMKYTSHKNTPLYNAVILGLEKLGNTATPGAWIHNRLTNVF